MRCGKRSLLADPTRQRVSVPTSPGRPLPGVNLDDNASLLDLMDGGHDHL